MLSLLRFFHIFYLMIKEYDKAFDLHYIEKLNRKEYVILIVIETKIIK